MKKARIFALAVGLLFVLWLCVMSCSNRYYKSSDFVGIFDSNSNILDKEAEYPRAKEEWLSGVVTLLFNGEKNKMTYKRLKARRVQK